MISCGLTRQRALKMDNIEGFILAGGASSRMGRDKAALRLRGSSFIERVSVALSRVACRTSIVSSRHNDEEFGLSVVPDVFADCGALGGLHAALAHGRTRWIAVVSCDLPFVTGELFERLAAFAHEGVDTVAPVQEDGRPQPLCALYAREPCLEAAERLLREGERRPRALLAQVRTRWAAFTELADLPGSALFFRNVNTPEDYERAIQSIELSDT